MRQMTNPSAPEGKTQAELLNDLKNGSPQEQEQAVIRLGAVGDAESLDAVVEFLRSQADGARGPALDTLRVLANKYMPLDRYGMAEAVIPFLSASEWSQRFMATRLLNTHPSELATGRLREVVQEAMDKVIAEQGTRFSTVKMLAERTLAESIMALASCGKLSALADIVRYLDNSELRPIAARALGMIGSETERDRLEDLTEDTDIRVRDSAQWALGLMDERIEMLTNPSAQPPEPPPDRMHPAYWAHRNLIASDDDLIQFLIVRLSIEHLILDPFFSDGRVPEECLITLRQYEGDTPPEFRFNRAEIVGLWQYQFQGPELGQVEKPASPLPPPAFRPGSAANRGASITVTYPITLPQTGEGLVSFDCLFGFFGRGWIYHVARQNEEWTFAQVRRTWAS
jgi:HEAT repeat protein